jgi:hypothetical protein
MKLAMATACGAALGLTTLASAQPDFVSISGATLLENLFNARAATVDFIDVDANGVARGFPSGTNQQLAPYVLPTFSGTWVWDPSVKVAVVYDAVGSTNGFQELLRFGRGFVTEPGTNTNRTVSLPIADRTVSYFNRYRHILAGVANNAGDDSGADEFPDTGIITNSFNPGGTPVRSAMTLNANNSFTALFSSTAVPSTSPNEGITVDGGRTVDIAPLDVPTTWAVTQLGTPGFELNPLEPGYGNNGRLSVDKAGIPTVTGHKLATLTAGAVLSTTPSGVYNPAATTDYVFDSEIVVAPVAPIANFGAGVSQIRMTELRHLFTTGRMPTGENLMAITRDSGSGTRNAWDNSLGIDPSWNVGENVGARNNNVSNDKPGTAFLPSNKGGNNRVEESVFSSRLAIGYVGPERGFTSSGQLFLTTGRCGIPDVMNDLPSYGGTSWVRPTADALLDNDGNTGYVIFGPGVVATFGDPKSAPAAKGGLGWEEMYDDNAPANGMYDLGEAFSDFNGNGVRDAVEARPAMLNPPMRNETAAAIINNFTRSIDAFVSLPGSDPTVFTAGEFASQQFILFGAVDNLKQSVGGIDPIVLVPNPKINQALQDFTRDPANGSVYTLPGLSTFDYNVAGAGDSLGNSRAGKVPNRTVAAATYSDQALVPAGDSYITEGGATLSYTNNLPLRNLIAGDFSGDGLRNWNDASEMIEAWRKRITGAAYTPAAASGALAALAVSTGEAANANDVCIEILGDFNGDGSFNAFDLRYFADGLAKDPVTGLLNRKEGFIRLDDALEVQTGGADINVFNTVLATGKPYAKGDARGDVSNALGRVTPGFQPIGADGYTGVIADANTINGADIDYVYAQFKQSIAPAAARRTLVTDGAANWNNLAEAVSFDLSADMTGDLIVDQADITELVEVILGTTYADVNLDGVSDCSDRDIASANLGLAGGWAQGDVDGDGVVTEADVNLIASTLCPADWDGSCTVAVPDIFAFLSSWFAQDARADFDGSGTVAVPDIFAFLSAWFAGC